MFPLLITATLTADELLQFEIYKKSFLQAVPSRNMNMVLML